MIFTPHILVGAAIGAKTHNLGLIVILGLLSHFIMDRVPHWDYLWLGIKDFKKNKNFKLLLQDFLKITADFSFGLLIVFFILWYKNLLNLHCLLFIILGIFISLLPDIILGFSWFLTGRPNKFTKFKKSIHYPTDKKNKGKITFIGLATEILVIIISCVVLLSL